MFLKSTIFWYTRLLTKTVKLNIRLEQELHLFTTEQWIKPWIDSFVRNEFYQSPLSGNRLQQASPLVEAYKPYFEAFHESLEITRSHRLWLAVELI